MDKGIGFGLTDPVGVLDVCLCLGCARVDGVVLEWVLYCTILYYTVLY